MTRREYDRAPDRPVHVLFVGLALILGIAGVALMAGCATAEKGYRVAYATTASTVAGAWRALDKYDQEHIRDILAMSHDSGRAELARYEAQLLTARQVLATATDALDVTHHGSKLYGFVAAKDWGHALQELMSIALAVRDALHVFGVEVP